MRNAKKLLLLILAMALFLAGCGKAAQTAVPAPSDIPESYAYSVRVTINPELKLYLDSADKILGVECLNDDAEAVLSDRELVGLDINAGLTQIVEDTIEKGYLQAGHDITIQMDEAAADAVDTQAILASAETAVVQLLEDKAFSANVIAKDASGEAVLPEETAAPADTSPQPAATAQPTTAPAESSAPESTVAAAPVAACTRCNGTGECQGCHGGKDACPACGGSGYETCPMCDANGLDHGQTCVTCGGSHRYLCTHCHGVGTAVDCPECGGSFKCPQCAGTGKQS